jgi:hypothetical protein
MFTKLAKLKKRIVSHFLPLLTSPFDAIALIDIVVIIVTTNAMATLSVANPDCVSYELNDVEI